MEKDVLISIIKDRPVTYHADIAKALGSVTAGLFLSQAIYWTGKGSEEGWFYKTREEWQNELGMSRKEQENARKKLKDQGVLEEQLRGLPARLYYRVNFDRLIEIMRIYYYGPGKPSWPESDQQAGTNMTSQEDQKSLPYNNTEMTTEMTANKVVVVEPPSDEKQTNTENCCSTVSDSAALNLSADDTEELLQTNKEIPTWKKIQSKVLEVAGTSISEGFAKEIAEKYPQEKIAAAVKELKSQLSQGREIRAVGGWLRYALQHDIQSDRPAALKTTSPKRGSSNNRATRARSIRSDTSYTKTAEQREKFNEILWEIMHVQK